MSLSRRIGVVVVLCSICGLAAIGIAAQLSPRDPIDSSWKPAPAVPATSEPLQATAGATGDSVARPGKIFNTAVTPLEHDTYQSATFRLWVPNDVKLLRGVIVYVHGCTDSSLDIVTNDRWLALASQWDMALMGMRFATHDNCLQWMQLEGGSDVAFLTALRVFARQTDHPELLQAPWVMYGYSAGAFWSLWTALQHPERVIAAFLRSGGSAPDINLSALNIPIMFSKGENDTIDNRETFHTYRAQGALWSFALEPGAGHEEDRGAWDLAIPFFDAVCAQRLPEPSSPSDKIALRDVDESRAWLGNLTTAQIAPINWYRGDKLSAAWFPDEKTARAWQKFVTGGKGVPKTK